MEISGVPPFDPFWSTLAQIAFILVLLALFAGVLIVLEGVVDTVKGAVEECSQDPCYIGDATDEEIRAAIDRFKAEQTHKGHDDDI